ncbi:MAG: universal stress protein, partial [Pseudomonadota bacterium]
MFKTILVPVDGSDHANKAVRIAGDLAGKYDANLILLQVLLRGHLNEGLQQYAEVEGLAQGPALSEAIASIPSARFPVSMVPGNGGDTKEAVLNSAAELILHTAKGAAQEQGAKKLRTLIEDGDPAQRILERATEMAQAFSCTASMETIAIVPAVNNSPEATASSPSTATFNTAVRSAAATSATTTCAFATCRRRSPRASIASRALATRSSKLVNAW